MKASASPSAGCANAGGASRSSAPAIRSNTSLSGAVEDLVGVFLEDLDLVLDLDFAIHAPRLGALLLASGRNTRKRPREKSNNYEGFASIRSVAIGPMAGIVRAKSKRPAR